MVTRSAASDLYFRYGTMSLLVGVLSCSLGDFSDLQRGSGKHGVGNPSPSGGSTSLGGNTGGVRALGKGGDTGGLSASAQGGSVSSGGAPGATGGVLSVNTGVGGAAGSALGGQGGTGGTSWVSGPAGGGNSQDCTQILADSLADFSSTQGKNGWHYGYYAAVSGLKSVNFVEMSVFGFSSALYEDSWMAGGSWTAISARGAHDSGTTSGGVALPVQWAVRRWNSTVDGQLLVRGTTFQYPSTAAGTSFDRTASIFVGDAQVWTQTVAAAQYNSVAFEAWVNVHVGDSLNFTINGAPPTGFSEGIGFQAQIFSCTNSSSGGSGGAGGTLGATGGSGGASGNVAQGGTAPVGGASAALGGMVSTPGAWQTVGQACSDSPPWTTDASPAVQLTVDAAQRGQTWNRFYERVVAADHANTVLSSAWGRNIQGALQKAHDQAGFQSVRFHGILDSDIGVYTEVNGSPVYAWTRFDQVYDAIVAAGMWPFVEISFTPPPLASDPSKTLNWYNGAPANISPPKDWNRWMDFMAAIVQHVEQRYGVDEVRNNWRFEIWNEASWMYSLGTAGYNELYSYTVRGLTRGDDQIKVGGPAESGGGSASSISSLISYARTNNLKLDFATYHYYAQDPSGNVALSTASAFFQGTMLSTVQTAKFTGELFATEWGPAYSTVVAQDTEIGASFIAKTIHLIGTSATVAPPSGYAYWTVSDIYEEFDTGKSLAYRNGNYGLLLKGDPNIPESFDVAKPAFNAFRILHMMGDVNLATSGGTQGDGVNAAATLASSDNSIRILVYNHADGGNANSALSSSVSVTVNNLPFGPGPVRMRQYVVDKTHSNSYNTWCQIGMPPQPDQSQWVQLRNDAELCYYETSLTPTNNSFSVTFPQNNYSVALMVLSQ